MTPPRGSARAGLLLALVILLWGVNWPIMKVGLTYISPLWFGVARTVLGAAALFALLAAQRAVRWPDRADWLVVLSVGVLQIAAFLGLANIGLQFVEAGRSAILAYTTPIWVAPLSALFLREPLGPARLAAVGLGIAGIAVLFNPVAVDWGDPHALLGNGLLLLAALAWAATIVHVRVHAWHSTPLQLMPWQLMLGALVMLPFAVALESPGSIDWTGELLLVLAYNGLVATAFCYWAFVTVNRSFGATTTAMGSLGVPVVGVLVSAIFLGEPLTATKLIGLGLICAGVVLLVRRNASARTIPTD